MRWLIILLPLFAWATSESVWRDRWMTAIKIVDRHEGYASGEMIKAPAGTWQLLASVVVAIEAPSGLYKDCLFVRVPEKDDGAIKIVSVGRNEDCKLNESKPSFLEVKELKAIQYHIADNVFQLWLTDRQGRVKQWKATMLNFQKTQAPQIHQSSAERSVFYFAHNTDLNHSEKMDLVGAINDQYPLHPCSVDKGECDKCRYGVYQVSSGEHFCGIDRCGEKNQPACLRGKKWQKSRETFSCRTDDSFVFCSPGLKVECEGERAICR